MLKFLTGSIACALALLTACRTMPPSNYASLTPAARDRVKPFTAGAGTDSLLQEITAADLRLLSRDHAYTWVVIWAPWCEPVEPYVNQLYQYERQLADRDVHLVLVDVQYSNKSALGKRVALRGGRPGYVINWRRYGRLAPLRFRQELMGKRRLNEAAQASAHHLLDRSGKLILWSDSINTPFTTLEQATRPQADSEAKASLPKP